MKTKHFHYLLIALLLLVVATAAVGDSNFTNVVASGDITASDDLTVTDDASVGGNLTVTGTSTLTGATTQTGALTVGGLLTVNDAVDVNGDSDEVQLTVTGYTTQTNHLFLLEATGGTDIAWVTNVGDMELNGTTPYLTIGDAGEEDAGIVLDGAAQDFNISLDDTADDLVIGLGSAAGTTDIIVLDENQDVGIGGASAGGKLDVTGNLFIDGAADEIQLHVQGNGTQTSAKTVVVEQSDGTDVLTIDNNGSIVQTINTAENVGMLPTWASANITYTDTTDIFAVTGSETWVVHNVLINITTNYDCTGNDCAMEIGPGTDPDGMVDLVDAEMQAADTEGTGWAAGWQGQLTDTTGALLVTNQDFVMDAADGIDVDVQGTSPAAGAATVWINYTRLD